MRISLRPEQITALWTARSGQLVSQTVSKPGLIELVQVWDELPENVRVGIRGVAAAVSKTSDFDEGPCHEVGDQFQAAPGDEQSPNSDL